MCFMFCVFFFVFFFKQKTAYEMRISDWSSDVCSSDLATGCGSLINLHFHRGAIRAVQDYQGDPARNARRGQLARLFHLDMIPAGQHLALRGLLALSLPLTDAG